MGSFNINQAASHDGANESHQSTTRIKPQNNSSEGGRGNSVSNQFIQPRPTTTSGNIKIYQYQMTNQPTEWTTGMLGQVWPVG